MAAMVVLSWTQDRTQEALDKLDKVCEQFKRFKGLDCTDRFVSRDFAIARFATPTSLSPQISRAPQGNEILAGCGWWYDPSRPSGHRPQLYDMYDESGHCDYDVINRLEGQYVLAVGDDKAGRVQVFCDPMAAVPTYYCRTDGIAWVSTSALAIAGVVGAKLDCESLRALFMEGSIRSPRSAFTNIKRLILGEAITISQGRCSAERVWNPYRPQQRYRNIHEAAEVGLELMAESWRRMQTIWGRCVSDLTAGLDSRMVVAAAVRAGAEFSTVVVGAEENVDVIIAREIAEHFGWPLKVLNAPHDWGSLRWDFFKRGIELAEGEILGSSIDKTIQAKEILRDGHAASTGGVGGELWRDFFWQQEFFRIGRTSSLDIRRLMKYRFLFTGRPRMSLFRRDWQPDYISEQAAAAQAIADIEPDALNTAKLDAIYIWKNSAGFARFGGAVSPLMASPFPLLGRALYDFSSSINWRYRLQGRLMREMITLASPELASLRTWYESTAEPLTLRHPVNYARYGLWAAKKLVRKFGMITIRKPIFPLPVRTDNRSHFVDFVKVLDKEGWLDVANLRTADLYDRDGLRQFLRDVQTEGFTKYRDMYALVTIEHLSRCCGLEPAQDGF